MRGVTQHDLPKPHFLVCPKATSPNLGKHCSKCWTTFGEDRPLWILQAGQAGNGSPIPASVPSVRIAQIKEKAWADLLVSHVGLSELTLRHPSETLKLWGSLSIPKPIWQFEKQSFPYWHIPVRSLILQFLQYVLLFFPYQQAAKASFHNVWKYWTQFSKWDHFGSASHTCFPKCI